MNNKKYELLEIKINESSKENQKFENADLLNLNQSIKEKNTKKKILDIIKETDFNFILENITGDNFSNKRTKLALILLYITGIKISILLKLKVSHLKQLLKNKYFIFPLKNNDSLLIFITKNNDKYLLEVQNCSKRVIRNKKNSDFVFTKKDETKSLSRETLTRTLNEILKKAGENLIEKKVFTTHSFRISHIQNLSKILPIEKVSQMIGHKNVSSTIKYCENKKYTLTEKKSIYKTINATKLSTLNTNTLKTLKPKFQRFTATD